jgi:hypothetical protein
MSQPDLLTELRAARPSAPAELRERVRLVAAQAPPTRRVTWRRAALVLVPAVAAVVVAAVVLPRKSEQAATPTVTSLPLQTMPATTVREKALDKNYLSGQRQAHGAVSVVPFSALDVPAPSGRVVRYSTYLELRVEDAAAISDATKRALRIATSLGGHLASVNVGTQGKHGTATLILRIPRQNVQKAVGRLSALGTIVGENVSIEDLTPSLNQTDRTMARLQNQLADLRAQTQTDDTKRRITALTRQIEGLQRAKANAIRAAHFATVQLELTTHKAVAKPTHHGHGPLHGLGIAFRWIGIGLVYGLALGGPLLAVVALAWLAARVVRRRREDALLSSP